MSRKKIFLHIGWEKTGSSAIQSFLYGNAEWLSRKGYLYPKLSIGPQHVELYWALSSPSPVRRHKMIGRMREIIEESDSDFIILSHERLHACDFTLFCEMLRPHDVQVIAYLRRHDEALVSLFATFVRWGMLRVAPRKTLFLRFAREYLAGADYIWPLRAFSAGFGRENVLVRVYDQDRFSSTSIVPDFMKLVGIQEMDGALWPNQRQNPSLTSQEMTYLLDTSAALDGQLGPSTLPATREIATALLAAPSRRGGAHLLESVPLRHRQRIIDMFSKSNALLSREFFKGAEVFSRLSEEDVPLGALPDDLKAAFDSIVINAPNVPENVKTLL